MAEEFTCVYCGGTFAGAWSEDEALEESRALFGDVPTEDLVVLCDDCFRDFMAWLAVSK